LICSMTGYGRGEFSENNRRYVVEVRTENNRFLDISIRLPRTLVLLEQKVKRLIQHSIVRGRILVTVSSEGDDEEKQHLFLDEELAESYYRILQDLKATLALPGDISIDVFSQLPSLITFESPERDVEREWDLIERALQQAIDDLIGMRQAEGELLQADMEKRINLLEKLISEIEVLAPQSVSEAKEKLQERLQTLVDVKHIDPVRFAIEAGLIAERCDVTEECVRFHSHNALFKETLRMDGTVGKRLGFLLQEMNREANTIGSKAVNAQISHVVIRIKEEVEKLREQVQNIE
jgi:uncharacterized protein (TIGR00255 family)